MPSTITTDAFPQYIVEANETGAPFYAFVVAYTCVALLLIVPLVRLGQHFERIAEEAAAEAELDAKKAEQLQLQQQQQQQQAWDAGGADANHHAGRQHGDEQQNAHKTSDITNQTESEGHSSLGAEETAPEPMPATRRSSRQQQQHQQHHANKQVPPLPNVVSSMTRTRSERSVDSRPNGSRAFTTHKNSTATTSNNATSNNNNGNAAHQADGAKPGSAMGQASTSHLEQRTRRRSSAASSALGFVFRGLDRVASAEYPDQDPDFTSQLSGSAMLRRHSRIQSSTGAAGRTRLDAPNRRPPSTVPSVATTSRLHSRQGQKLRTKGALGSRSQLQSQQQQQQQQASNNQRQSVHSSGHSITRIPAGIWDVNGRRWKTRRPIGRVDTIRNAIRSESFSMKSWDMHHRGAGQAADGSTPRHIQHLRRHPGQARNGTMSDVANGMLVQDPSPAGVVVHPSMLRRLSMGSQRHQLHGNRFVVGRLSRTGSFSTLTGSEPSIMPSIVDDITPNDAADADDPGRGNIFMGVQDDDAPTKPVFRSGYGVKLGCMTSAVEAMFEIAEIDDESGRIFRLALPLTIGAMAEPLFRLITVAFISNYLGSNEMVAFLLVVLFARLTIEQVAGAVIDALSAFVQQAIYSGEPNAAIVSGQCVQLAVVLQILLCSPLVVIWMIYMGDVVEWLVQSSAIADIAADYTKVILFHYLIQAIGRTFTVVFHICGHEHFESVIDFFSHLFSMITIACITRFKHGADLTVVGYTQLLIGIAAAMIKILYPVAKGWMKPFRKGLLQSFALYHNFSSFVIMATSTVPLLIGTFLEFGEWELLTIFLQYLGPAEVATWALLGNVWEILEASTEGIGEAAAIRVAYLLSIPNASRSRKLANKIMWMSIVGSLIATSILYMAGRPIAVLLTSDRTIQHLLNDTIGLLGIANITMAFSQISWSLIGAQGRFRLATIMMFFSRWLVAMPIALIVIFGFFLDLNAVVGAITVGYATAACTLSYVVLRSDWERLARTMQEISTPLDEDEDALAGLEGLDLDDFENDDDEDDDDEYDYGDEDGIDEGDEDNDDEADSNLDEDKESSHMH